MKNRIRALRKAKGWTLNDLAERMGPDCPTPQTVARLETGTRTLTLPWLDRFAAALDVTPQELLTLAGGPSSPIIGHLDTTGVIPAKRAAEIDLSVLADDPVAIEFSVDRLSYKAGDILVFERLKEVSAIKLDEALVALADETLLFGSLFPPRPGRPRLLIQPPPQASLFEIGDVEWIAKPACLIRRL